MNKTMKRVISMAMVLMLVLSLSVMAFAEGTVTPNTGTIKVYAGNTNGGTSVDVTLATGTKSFTVKRASVKVASSNNDAKITGFYKQNSSYSRDYKSGDTWKNSYSNVSYRYEATLQVSGPGTTKINYKIGTTSYTLTVKVLAYKNPIQTVTLKNSSGKGVNGGANMASLFAESRWTSNTPVLNAKTTNAKLNVVPATGWVIQNLEIEDEKTNTYTYMNNSKGMKSATLRVGTLYANRDYWVYMTLRNTSNNATQNVYFTVRGANA